MNEDNEAAQPPAEPGQKLRNRSRCVAILGQRQDAATRSEMEPQRVKRSPVQCDGRAISNWPAKSRCGQIESAQLRHDRHFVKWETTDQCDADAVPERIAASQHSHVAAALCGDRLDRTPERPLPEKPFGAALRHHAKVASTANQQLSGPDERPRRRSESGQPVLADADYRKPWPHATLTRALTAAAASAPPPRGPSSVMWAIPRPKAASAAFASAAPTKPTGKPRMRAGFPAPAAMISSRWYNAVGAFPIATIAPSRCGRHNSTAAADRVVPRAAAIPAVLGSRRVHKILLPAASRSPLMPASTIVASTRIGAPAARARRPTATAPPDQAR